MSPVIALHAPRVALPEGTPPALRQGLRAAGCTVLAQGTHPDGAAEGTFDWVLCSAAEWAELQALKCQLEERRWTERAKSLLMQSQQIDETQSYKLLRDAAMQAQRKLPALARQLVHQHEQAEALERAGAQRMLSQRLVRLQAQALLDLDGRLARAWQAESVARVQGNLARLQELLHGPVREQELAAVQAAWKQLEGVLTAPPCREGLAALDAAAQSLLDASEALVDTLCQQAGQRPPHLLVLCTRQRLLSQRLVKEALLSQLDPAHDPQRLALGLDEFLRALQTLRNAPLHSPGLQTAFAAVDLEWDRLLRGLRQGAGPQSLQDLCERSERLLQALDALTQVVQRSLQTLLG